MVSTVAGQLISERLPLEHAAIHYSKEAVDNPVTWLVDRLERGDATLDFRDDGLGYLPSLLDELDVHVDSQTLVFSKTGFQTTLISPESPRAIYFNDDTAVGFVRGGDIEVITFDPGNGVVFYTLPARRVATPRPTRNTACLQCHFGPATQGVPGLFVTSVPTDQAGQLRSGSVPIVTDHRTPIGDRWRGWVVNEDQPDTSVLLTPTSDRVALMTLEHQTQVVNLLTRLEWETQIARHGGLLGYALAEHMRDRVEHVLSYMLFVGEAALTEPIAGVSTFTETFPRRGPHDRDGRSLRDFDLETRLFRYPLSYMIYSRAFDVIEPVVREYLLRRLYDVLIGDDTSEAYSDISASERLAVLTILRDTKPRLPTYWRRR